MPEKQADVTGLLMDRSYASFGSRSLEQEATQDTVNETIETYVAK
jgi:hypothetical protein